MGTSNDCYWLAETPRERLDSGAWLHWSEPLMTRPPGFSPSPPPRSSIPLANPDGADTESYDGEAHLGVPEIDDRRSITGERQSVVFVI